MDPLDMTKAARERRQKLWEEGNKLGQRLVHEGYLDPPAEAEHPYEQYLYLKGIADAVTARARDIGFPGGMRGPELDGEGRKKR